MSQVAGSDGPARPPAARRSFSASSPAPPLRSKWRNWSRKPRELLGPGAGTGGKPQKRRRRLKAARSTKKLVRSLEPRVFGVKEGGNPKHRPLGRSIAGKIGRSPASWDGENQGKKKLGGSSSGFLAPGKQLPRSPRLRPGFLGPVETGKTCQY